MTISKPVACSQLAPGRKQDNSSGVLAACARQGRCLYCFSRLVVSPTRLHPQPPFLILTKVPRQDCLTLPGRLPPLRPTAPTLAARLEFSHKPQWLWPHRSLLLLITLASQDCGDAIFLCVPHTRLSLTSLSTVLIPSCLRVRSSCAAGVGRGEEEEKGRELITTHFFRETVLHSPGWPQTPYAAKDDLILLPPPPESWNYKGAPSSSTHYN